MILCELIQSMIRTVIGSVFLYRFLTMLGYKRVPPKVSFVLYISVFFAFDVFLCIDIFLKNGGITCDAYDIDWQIFTLICLDTLQAISLVITSVIMAKKAKYERLESISVLASNNNSSRSALTSSIALKDPNKRFKY